MSEHLRGPAVEAEFRGVEKPRDVTNHEIRHPPAAAADSRERGAAGLS